MGATASAIPADPVAFSIARGEYDRIKARIEKEINTDMEDYERLPYLNDAHLQIRLRECFDCAVEEKDLDITETRSPIMISYKMNQLSDTDKKAYMENVVLAAIDNEKANYKPKTAAQDYSKSFSGSAADTKAEKEAAALMKGESSANDEDEEIEENGPDCNPYLRKPAIKRTGKSASQEEKEMRKLFQAHDKLILQDVSLSLKFLGASGCFVYINSGTKEVVSLRPRDYDEEDDIGGGIALANEQIAAEEGAAKKKGNIFATDNTADAIPDGMLTCTLAELPATLDELIDVQGKTPLILDNSSEQKVRVFMEYKHRLQDVSALTIPFGKSGLRSKDVLENCRKTLVGALKSGTTMAFYLGDANIEHADFKKKLCKKDVFPVDTFTNAGKRLMQNGPDGEPRYKQLFREEDLEAGQACVRGDTFRFLAISSLKPSEWYEKLQDCLPTGYMVPVYCSG